MNWKAILQIISVIPSLVQLVAQTVQAVEHALEGLDGATKLKAATTQIEAFLAGLIDDANVLAALPAILKPMIDGWVAAYNAIGLFKHDKQADQVTGA